MHIRALDGVRGLAVLLVALFHYGYAAFGWIGVQIFFVLSGYLITSILLNTRDLPLADYLGRFYWRRSLRIFPLYFLVILVALVTFAIWREPAQLMEDLPYLLTYTSNFARLKPDDIGHVFVHLWSLAVEEQFYLIWPIVIYWIPRRHLKLALATIIVGSPLVRLAVYFAFKDQPEVVGRAVYCLPFTQFDAFAFGAAITVWNLQRIAHAGRAFSLSMAVMALAGAATLAYAHFYGGGAFKAALGYPMYLLPGYGFIWGYSLIDIASMLGIVCLLQRATTTRLFESGPLVFTGVISYGIYILHVPVLVAMSQMLNKSITAFILYLAMTIGLAAASFRFFETPFLALKDRQSVRPLVKREA